MKANRKQNAVKLTASKIAAHVMVRVFTKYRVPEWNSMNFSSCEVRPLNRQICPGLNTDKA